MTNNGWQTKKLGDITVINGGGTPPTSHSEYFDGDVPWFTPSEITSGTVSVLTDSRRQITEEATKFSKVAEQGTVLLSSRATIGNIGIVSNRSTYNQGIKGISPKEELNHWFLAYWLLANKRILEKSSYGTTFKELSTTALKRFDIAIPSIPVQQQIVEKLDSIRKLQELNDKEIEKVEEIFNAYFNSTFVSTGKWPIKNIREVAIVNPPKPKFNDWDLEKEVDFLPMSALATDAQNPYTAEKRKLKEVIKGYTCFQSDDVLLAKITPCFENGKTGIFRKNPKSVGFGSTEFIVLRADEKKAVPLWIWLFIFSKRFREEGKLHMTGTAGQKRLPVSFVENYQIPVPSLMTQLQIIEKFQNIASLFDLKKKEKEKLSELFESTLNKLMKPN